MPSSDDTRPLHLHRHLVALCEDLNPLDWQSLAEVQAALQTFQTLSRQQGQTTCVDLTDLTRQVDAIILEQVEDLEQAKQHLLDGVRRLLPESAPAPEPEATAPEQLLAASSATLDRLAADLLATSTSDWQALQALADGFDTLASERTDDQTQARCREAKDLIDAIILERSDDLAGLLDQVGEIISGLQDEPAAPARSTTTDSTSKPAITVDPDSHKAEICREFIGQTEMLLDDLDTLVLTLEKHPDLEAETRLRGLIHTFKGEAGILGFDILADWAHRLEDLLEARTPAECSQLLFRNLDWLRASLGELPAVEVLEESVQPLFADIDRAISQTVHLQAIQNHSGGPATDNLAPNEIIAHDGEATEPDVGLSPETEALGGARPLPAEADVDTLREFITEANDHLHSVESSLLTLEAADKPDPEHINALFRGFHTIKGLAGFLDLTREQKLAHVIEELLDRVRSGSMAMTDSIIQTVFKALDIMRQVIDSLSEAVESGGDLRPCPALPKLIDAARQLVESNGQRLGEILLESHAVKKQDLEEALEQQRLTKRPVGEILLGTGKIDKKELTRALKKQAMQRNDPAAADQGRSAAATGGKPVMMKVDAERIDNLADVIGELVVAQGMLNEADPQARLGSRDIRSLLGRFERITRNLQDMATNLRMVPVGPVFQRMARLVRDLARKLGKPVEFRSEGGDVELDKTLVDRLADPLVHMVRNAVDHGLEADPHKRLDAGKAEAGQITLRAFHEGGHIHIEVSDDGRGLDRDRILAKAIERGLVRPEQELSDQEIHYLIFQPGFSTAQEVTDVSGRGVGMDVVKRMVEDLRGQVLIRSVPGEGTTFTFVLPLTAAIIDGMLVQVGQRRYIIPTLSIVTSLRPRGEEFAGLLGWGRLLELHGHQIPVFSLEEVFAIDESQVISGRVPEATTPEEDDRLAVVVTDGSSQVGLMVDALLGRQQVVIKPLGDGIAKVAGISGATITGDGRVCLIVDTGGLIRYAMNHPQHRQQIPA